MSIIQSQLGHASLATTDTYLAHIAPKQVIETIRKRCWSLDEGERSSADPAREQVALVADKESCVSAVDDT